MTTTQIVKSLGLVKFGDWCGTTGPSYVNETFVLISSRRRVGRGVRREYVQNWSAYKKGTSEIIARANSLHAICERIASI